MAIFLLLLLKQLAHASGYEDLSFRKPSAQSPPYIGCSYDYDDRFCKHYHARNAVDRSNGTCTRTEQIGPTDNFRYRKAWWYVDLDDIYSIYGVHILFKSYEQYELRQRGRLAGFSLFLSNSTNIENGSICYKDGPDVPLLDLNATCVGHARYLFFYNERLPDVVYPPGYEMRSFTELCEVTVYGCAEGMYGNNCDLHCPDNCQGGKCHIVKGTCFRCKPGWVDEFCNQECSDGSYGFNCKNRCSGHCLNGLPCNHITGICLNKCAAGWTGIKCEKTCIPGKFGPNCAFTCSGHCKDNSPCNRETGHCRAGCNIGYRGAYCSQVCAFGRFGKKCANICNGNCLYNETCSHVSGICTKGCARGYIGSLCNNVCPDGLYGLNCSSTCSPNCIGSCEHVDGSCKCVPGFTDSPNCTKECPPGFYGVNCKYRCSDQCVNDETCSRYDGSCPLGCKDNYVGVACDFLEDSSTSAATVGLAIIVAVFSLCFMAAFIFFDLRPKHCISLKEGKPKVFIKDSKSEQSSFPKTKKADDDTQNYQDLNPTDAKNSYELLQSSKNECAYQNLDLTI